MTEMNEVALQQVVEKMKTFHPGLTAGLIRQTIKHYLRTGATPITETAQDIVWAYNDALKDQD